MDADLEALRVRFYDQRERLDRLRAVAEAALATAMRSAGRTEVVGSRTKELISVLKKALRKQYVDPWREIEDKVGLRVVVTYASDLRAVRDLIDQTFVVRSWEDKAEDLEPHTIGYLGIHAVASLPAEMDADLASDVFEVQLHTRAQSLWASLSHEMLYKSSVELGGAYRRRLFRLVALAELIDQEADRCKEALMGTPGYEVVQVLDDLERHFRRFTGVASDRELSVRVLAQILPRCSIGGGAALRARIDSFVDDHEEDLRRVYARYAQDARHPLMSQPESILVFEEFERDRFAFMDAWSESFPSSLISLLAPLWGTSLVDE